MLRIDQIDIKNKKVLIRVDFNVPISNGEIKSDFRIKETLDTINYCMENDAKIILMSHLGRPKGIDPSLSLFPIYKYLQSYFPNINILFSSDCISDNAFNRTKRMSSKDIHLLENLRFYNGELSNSDIFSKNLSKHADVYINDAFGTAHRMHASNASILRYCKVKGIGFLMNRELQYLSNLPLDEDKTISLLLGGSKVSSKLAMIRYFLDKANYILIGGAMSYTFLKAKGLNVGKSLVEDNMIDEATFILNQADKCNTKIVLPIDAICSKSTKDNQNQSIKDINDIDIDEMGVDIGEKTIVSFSQIIKGSDLIIWNGPMGVFEIPAFSIGTKEIAKIISQSTKNNLMDSIIGGGDTASAVINFKLESNFTHVSTGGGASLELLSGKTLQLIKSWETYE